MMAVIDTRPAFWKEWEQLIMIVFVLTMPHCASWNGRWSQADRLHVRTRDERKVPKEYWNKDFYYRWSDGWEACVSVTRMPSCEARKLEKKKRWILWI